ncbi:MAG: Stp1/IreP family PP2C-type Ser/Thr phosphatase [Acidobacteria bacterium]|nr:Stp1/IreP family PP2C-type Ser/Thr phosphatase [Acidobacteriota bacterium]
MTMPKNHNLCLNCSAADNEVDALFCQTCGMRLGAPLISLPLAPEPVEVGTNVEGRFVIDALLWSAPAYNAYSAFSIQDHTRKVMVIEQTNKVESFHTDRRSIKGQRLITGSLENAAPLFSQWGLLKPLEQLKKDDRVFTLYEMFNGQALAQLDPREEKEVRAIGLQLCELADTFHKHGWIFNGFEPYNVIIDQEGQAHLLSFDRVRQQGADIEEAPIYTSRGYTAPEVFIKGAKHQAAADVYAIGALLQFLLAGESLGDGVWLYPVATVYPKFERVVTKALAEDPAERFVSIAKFHEALASLNLPVILQSGHFTDVGLVRELNEDSVLSLNLTQYYESVQTQIGLYIVSDGMGGEAAGEVASRVTVRSVAEWVTDKLISASLKSTQNERIAAPTQTGGLRLSVVDGHEMATTEMLKKAVLQANQEVLAYARKHPDESGLGATCTVAMIVGDILTLAHVGDSRCYLLSGDQLEQLTEDHSVVQKMINTGNLSRTQAKVHPYRNVIYRSIGADEEMEVDIIRRKLLSGDTILLCSDGLNGMLSDDQIRDILMVNPDPYAACKELVVAANAAGGDDNTSVIVVRLT